MTPTRVIVYYTDSALPSPLAAECWRSLLANAAPVGAHLVAVSHAPPPVDWPRANLVAEIVPTGAERCPRQIYENIAAGLDAAAKLTPRPDYAYLAEHDCLYLDAHFAGNIEVPTRVCYDCQAARLTRQGWILHHRPLLSAVCGPLDLLRAVARERREHCRAGHRYVWGEFGVGDSIEGRTFAIGVGSIEPRVIDVRWGRNFTGGTRAGETIDELRGWGHWRDTWTRLGGLEAYL